MARDDEEGDLVEGADREADRERAFDEARIQELLEAGAKGADELDRELQEVFQLAYDNACLRLD